MKHVVSRDCVLPPTWWFLAWLILLPWIWRQHFPPKRQFTFNRLYGHVPEDRTIPKATNGHFCFFTWQPFIMRSLRGATRVHSRTLVSEDKNKMNRHNKWETPLFRNNLLALSKTSFWTKRNIQDSNNNVSNLIAKNMSDNHDLELYGQSIFQEFIPLRMSRSAAS
jgi:hypothetical protein